MSTLDFQLETLAGTQINLSELPAKAYLIVNTASQCAFTSQYAALERLHQKFHKRGLLVMGFPCDQFGQQEPGNHQEIAQFCQRNYGVSFPMFAKIDVNGKNAHPLFQYLKTAAPGILGSRTIKWNFTKFLMVPERNMIRRYAPAFPPQLLERQLTKILKP